MVQLLAAPMDQRCTVKAERRNPLPNGDQLTVVGLTAEQERLERLRLCSASGVHFPGHESPFYYSVLRM